MRYDNWNVYCMKSICVRCCTLCNVCVRVKRGNECARIENYTYIHTYIISFNIPSTEVMR